jgi:hypothetical protein
MRKRKKEKERRRTKTEEENTKEIRVLYDGVSNTDHNTLPYR